MRTREKILGIFQQNVYFYLIGLVALDAMLYSTSKRLGNIGVIVVLSLLLYYFWNNYDKRKKWNKFIDHLNEDVDASSYSSLTNLPLSLCIVDKDTNIIWYNSKFKALTASEHEIIGLPAGKVFPGSDVKILDENIKSFEVKIADRTYEVLKSGKIVREGDVIYTLYWLDVTEHRSLKEQYFSEKALIAHVQVDNFDEVMATAVEGRRPFILSDVESRIKTWASRINAVVKKIENDKYYILFERRYLENMETKKFMLLDDIREIDTGNTLPITLSLGIGTSGKNLFDLDLEAKNALELALGRGGDQAVVKKGANYDFYGGRSKNVERRNKVKARVVAHALIPLIDDSNRVFIMGHKFPDMDSFGASVGIYRAVLNRGKKAYIVLNQDYESIAELKALFDGNDEYRFIDSQMASESYVKEDLLVIVDTHRPNFTEAPELLDMFKRKVLIDHHRRGTEFIEDTALSYTEPYASSTSELVTEILQYMDEKVKIERVEADALLAGIILDTKGFVFKTGVRTFDAASLLKRNGADTLRVRELFKGDIETIITKSNIVSNTTIYRDSIAISRCETKVDNVKVIASQGADELLNIKGVNTSFVLGEDEDEIIFISGRSNGGVNVQLIMEKLGGGGHLTTAGAQFEGANLEDVVIRLKEAIDEVIDKEEK